MVATSCVHRLPFAQANSYKLVLTRILAKSDQRCDRLDALASSELMDRTERQKINWTNSIAFALLHGGALAALFMFSWPALAVAVFLHWMSAGLGISMGYHRLHTHRSYAVPLALEYFFAVCGTLTLQGGPMFWVATHRIHHHKSDQPGDPHSPCDGGWWAHIGWLLVGDCKLDDSRLISKYAPDLAKHRFYVWLNNYHWVPLIVLALLLLGIGGIPFLLWGICLRVVVGFHSTWLVNSATHMWGSRRFATRDNSRNNWWVALITSGEGWHNNHHAHPTSARHGLLWYEFDLSWIQIKILKFFGLAKSVRIAKVTSARAGPDAA
jgi:fatty-acid desaturase